MEHPREIWTSEEGSMAWATARTRWPKIVQGMVDDVQLSTAASPSSKHSKEGHDIQSALQQLKNEILQNDALQ